MRGLSYLKLTDHLKVSKELLDCHLYGNVIAIFGKYNVLGNKVLYVFVK